MIESMACGTPVIAFNKGAVPEIMVDGKTGFVVDSLSAMIKTVGLIDSIDPRECRRHVQDHFSITSMAYNYSELYYRIIGSHKITYSHSRFSNDHPYTPLHHGQRVA
jgi:glycosyltransferase involved in cell wall biosynthesis